MRNSSDHSLDWLGNLRYRELVSAETNRHRKSWLRAVTSNGPLAIRGWKAALGQLSLARQFLLLGSGLVLVGLGILGYWVSGKIEAIVMEDVSLRAASYFDTIVSPHIQGVATDASLPRSAIEELDRVIAADPAGIAIKQIKVWSPTGMLLFDTDKTQIGHTFALTDDVQSAVEGKITIDFDDEEHFRMGQAAAAAVDESLLEVYVPVYRTGTGEVIAVGEFYQDALQIRDRVGYARLQSWGVTSTVSIGLIAGLYTVVARGSSLIERQSRDLDQRVRDLTLLLDHNRKLQERIRIATQRSASDSETHLRRIGSDLHDGVGQLISIVMLKLNGLFRGIGSTSAEYLSVRSLLEEAMSEIRDMSAGLALPEIERLSLRPAIDLIVSRHEKRTGTEVSLVHRGDLAKVSQPMKLCACRFVQEALNNAYKHAGGAGQTVATHVKNGILSIRVSDLGPGIAATRSNGKRQALGLSGLRNRLESFGGTLTISDGPDGGTVLSATLFLDQLKSS